MFRFSLLPRLARRMADEGGLRLGRPFGIDVRLHPGGLFLLVVMAAALMRPFGDRLAIAGGFAGVLAGCLLTAALLAASVLVHELAHAVVARRLGVPVRGVAFHLLGGVVRFERPIAEPVTELRVAAAGPAASLLVAGLAVAATFGFARLDPGSSAAWIAGLLAVANAAMGIVNLLPAYPLDGGRILRAMLWRGNGCPDRSTWLAARAARTFAWASLLTGVALAIQSGPWALSIAFLGWFVGEEAARSERRTRPAMAASYSAPVRRSPSPPSSIAAPQRAGGRLQVTTAKPRSTTSAGTLASTPKPPPVQSDQFEDVSRSTGSR